MINNALIFVLILISSAAFSQQQKATELIDHIVDSLKKKHADQYLLAEGVYDWVTRNIMYDPAQALLVRSTGRELERTPESIIQTRTGVCTDFSLLTKILLNKLGIECNIVGGYTRLIDSCLINFTSTGAHAWNSVRINKKWFLMDCTLASTVRQFYPLRKPYFLLTPEQFILTHYPYGGKEDYLGRQTDVNIFLGYPVVHRYFEYFRQLPDLRGRIITYTGSIKLKMNLVKDSLLAELYDPQTGNQVFGGETIKPVKNDPQYTSIGIPQKGKFLLQIYKEVEIESFIFEQIHLITYLVERK